uniref:H-type lectin domain-containing protein n=1 Tax=Arion vulgaris TaxID=1028688 RepID=A0A0B7BA86_9EUPU
MSSLLNGLILAILISFCAARESEMEEGKFRCGDSGFRSIPNATEKISTHNVTFTTFFNEVPKVYLFHFKGSGDSRMWLILDSVSTTGFNVTCHMSENSGYSRIVTDYFAINEYF